MGTWYIPQRDADFNAWARAFSSLIAGDPAAYGISGPDSAALSAAYAGWSGAFAAATDLSTRTAGAIIAKNQSKEELLMIVKRLAAAIRADPAVTAAQKVGLGLRAPDGHSSPVPPPESSPTLSIVAIRSGEHLLEAVQLGASNPRARPRGATGLLVFRTVAEGPVQDPHEAAFLSLVTRGAFTSGFTRADRGRFATYFARWANAKGELGPWSLPATAPIAA
jgi:hypothetical protein